jgi:hypothetical protein
MRTKTKTSGKPKKLSYLLINRLDEKGRVLYDLVDELVDRHHPELREARIALAWNLAWQPDVDGRCILGKCKKASDLDRELMPVDFVIILRREFFEDLRVTDLQRRALLDHELNHAAVKYDADGRPVIDQRGRTVFRIRKHDLEEFAVIAERYGTWKKDIEAFAGALDRARQKTADVFVGYSSLRELLIKTGLTLTLDRIVEWSDQERREAQEWAVLQLELARTGMHAESRMPAHVAAAAEQTVATVS